MLCSIGYNEIGVEGASALAAILKETMISNLECAASPSVFAFVSAPADKKANVLTLWQPLMHLSDIPCPCDTQRRLQRHHG